MYEQLTNIHPWLPGIAGVGVLLVAAVLSDLVIRRGLLAIVGLVSSRTSFQWGDVLKRHKIFSRLTHVIPAIVIHIGITFVPDLANRIVEVTQKLAMAYVALTVTLAFSAALSAANEVYETYPVSRDRPLKGIVQVFQLLVFIYDLTGAPVASRTGRFADRNLLLYADNRLGRLRRRAIRCIRSYSRHTAGIRFAAVSETGRNGSGELRPGDSMTGGSKCFGSTPCHGL
jgi:hypothetical protein